MIRDPLSIFLHYTSDMFVFITFHVALLILLAFSIIRDYREKRSICGVKASVIRGNKSTQDFRFIWGLLSFVAIEWINLSSSHVGHKLIFAALDVSALMYLCFYNAWFQNKVLYLLQKSRECDL